MIPELGQFSLILALLIAIVQSILPIAGVARKNSIWINSAKYLALLQFWLVLIAFMALMRSYIVSDFTVTNVVNNSHSNKPLLYKIVGTWGNHEGSILLWVLILVSFGGALSLFSSNIPITLRARVLSVQGWICVGFISFMLFTSNPFERTFPPPLNGNDLNPLLQDIGLAIHPPLLYVGYVGFSLVFSFAIAALLEGEVSSAWARWVRPWILISWTSLSAGIALGAWWAYYELGWGGWWFWDPVENVSFMPWLVGTALLHSAIVTEKRGAFKAWTVLLAILTFSLSLLGTFIVRSGLLTSVHSFAVDPERGIYILILLALSIGGSLLLFAYRAPSLEGGGLFSPISRESGLLLNNLFLTTSAAIVLFGTLYPLFLEGITGEKISVGPPFFNISFTPIGLMLGSTMAIGPYLKWKKADIAGILSRIKFLIFVSLAVSLFVWYLKTSGPIFAVVGVGVSVWLFTATLFEWMDRVKLINKDYSGILKRIRSQPRSANGMTIAHLGMSFIILGVVGSSAWKEEVIGFVEKGSQLQVASFLVTFGGVSLHQGPNYNSETATVKVEKDNRFLENLYPERRLYLATGTSTTESAIRQSLAGDLYVTISEPANNKFKGKWVLRLIYEPLVNFIWLGASFLALGGIISITDRRYKVGRTYRYRRTKPTNKVVKLENF